MHERETFKTTNRGRPTRRVTQSRDVVRPNFSQVLTSGFSGVTPSRQPS